MIKKPVKTAVVILNWNGLSLLKQWLGTVVAHSLNGATDVEVVLADNGSTDSSLEYVRTAFPDTVRCLDLKHNHGFAQGYNLALAEVNAEYVVLLNSDVEVTPGWLDPLIAYLDTHPEVAGCQPKIRSLRQRETFEHAGAAGGYIDWLGYPFCRGRIMNDVEVDTGQYETVEEVFWATGACLCIRLDAFREVGGLDARFFAHMEEIDLCWRLWQRGFHLVCVPQSTVYHLGGATLHKSNPRKTFLNFRNNLLMIYKNRSTDSLWAVLLIRGVMDYLSACVFLLTGKTGDALAVFKARWAFWRLRKQFKTQRQENLRLAKRRDIPGLYKGSLVLGYYVCGKRRFTDFFPVKAQREECLP